jgi:hypothetical protein
MDKELIEVGQYTFNTFKDIVKQLRDSNAFPKPFEFTVNKTSDTNFSIFIVGNKLAGDDYTLNTWKTVPIVDCSIGVYSPSHPATPSKEYLRLNVWYSSFWGSEYACKKYIDNGLIKQQLEEAIKTAIVDFTVQETI